MNTLILLALLAVSLADFVAVTTYNSADCEGDFVNYVATKSITGLCKEGCASVSLNGFSWSTKTSCPDRAEIPDGTLGWAVFPTTPGCAGEPSTVLGYGSGCFNLGALAPVGFKSSYKAGCNDDGALTYNQYSTDDCSGEAVNGMTQSHPFGCFTVGQTSFSQLGCGEGAPDYTVYLEGWLKFVTAADAWVVTSFNTNTQKCFNAAGDFSIQNGNTVQVSVTINTCTAAEIKAFVDDVCKDFITQANVEVCLNANCASGTIGATCTHTENTKRDGQQTSITINGAMNAEGEGGAASGLVFPFLALMLSVLALVL